MTTNRNLARYYKKVGRALNCSPKARKQIIANLKSDLEEYMEQNPTATDEQLLERFGTPDDYAQAFLAQLGEEEWRSRLRANRFGKRFWIIFAIAATLVVAITTAYVLHRNKQQAAKYDSGEVVSSVVENSTL